MPLIQVNLIENPFTREQKREWICKLTDAVVAVKGESMHPVTWVLIEDIVSGEMGNRWTAHDHKSRALAGSYTGRSHICHC